MQHGIQETNSITTLSASEGYIQSGDITVTVGHLCGFNQRPARHINKGIDVCLNITLYKPHSDLQKSTKLFVFSVKAKIFKSAAS